MLALAAGSVPACARSRAATPHQSPIPVPTTAHIERTPYLPDVSDRAWRIWRAAIVIDAHNDMPTKMLDDGYDADVIHDPGTGKNQGETDLPRLVQSGITGQFLSDWVDASYARQTPNGSFARALVYEDTIHAFVNRHPDQLLFATTAADVRRAKSEGKVAILIGVEGGHAIQNSLDNLRTLYDRGARYMTLTWNNGNDWAGSSVGVNGTRTGGLTEFGRQVVHEMNRLGMLVDVSHVSDSTFYDAIAASSAPVIASHSSARALGGHARDLSDDQLRAIARNGGVVNVNFYASFIDPRYRHDVEAVDRRIDDERRTAMAQPGVDSVAVSARLARERDSLVAAVPPVPLSVLIDHFDHVARVAGVDHVGIGSDFDGVGGLLPERMKDVTMLPRIVQGLLDRGYSDADITKMIGGNMMRVMAQVLDHRSPADAR